MPFREPTASCAACAQPTARPRNTAQGVMCASCARFIAGKGAAESEPMIVIARPTSPELDRLLPRRIA